MPATHFKPTMTIESSSMNQSSLPVWRQQQQHQQTQKIQVEGHQQTQKIQVEGHQQTQKIQVEGHQQQVAISGVAGRFPEAFNVEQYAQCLFNQSKRTFHQESQQFDAQFYGISSEVAKNMTTVQKQVTEQIYDSLIDAGVQPIELRNNRTGLFIATNIMNKEHTRVNAHFYQTVFNFQGPVQMFEEQFSSSFLALDQARRAIQEGRCEYAIVCAVEFSSTGVPTIASIFLQKKDQAKRFYAVLLQSQVVPSCEYKQIQQVYTKWNVEPSLVTYVETIGQNNQVEEYRCLAQIYATNVERSLPVFIGQAETEQKYATGIQALIRMIVAIQTGVIPASQQQQRLSQEMFSNQDVKMVKTNTKFFGGLMALNGFTFNGQFVNILVQPNTEYLQTKMGNKSFWNQQEVKEVAQMPRLYTCAAQSQQALEQSLEQVRQNPSDMAAQFLLSQQSQWTTPVQQQYRAYTVLNADQKIQQLQQQVGEKRPVYYLFNGAINTEFLANYEQLMKIQRFRESIEQACHILTPYGINLRNYIFQQQQKQQQETIGFLVAHTAIQMALVDCLKAVGVQQSGMLGYSIGELACAYADECLTFEQTLLTAYQRAKLIQDSRLPSGAMATVSLTWEQAQKRCPATLTLACHNYENNVTVSGPLNAIRTFVQELTRENIQAKILNTNEIAYHSQYMTSIASQLKKRLEQIITTPKQRSAKWLSTSFAQQRWSSEMAKYASAEYFVNNLCNHVLLRETMSQIPANAIVVEIGPQSVMDMIVKANLHKSVYYPLMAQRQEQQLINFWTQLGNMYVQGVQVQPMNILVPVFATLYPVPVTTRFLTARTNLQQYRQHVDDAQELKSQLEKKYENMMLKGESCRCVNVASTECQKHYFKQQQQQQQQQDLPVQQLAKQYMQTYQQEKIILIKYFARQQQEMTVQQKKIVEELETLIRQTPANQAEWIGHFQQQLEVLQSLDVYCPRQEAEQTRLIQDLKEMICEQIRYCRQSEVTRRQMEKQQYNALMAKDTQFKCMTSDRQQQRLSTKYEVKYTIDLTTESECNLLGHKIQGKYVYPVSGFIYLIWKSYAKMMGYTSVDQCPIQFTNIKFLHQITMIATDRIQFTVDINQVTGLFQLIESNKVVCTGYVENLDSMVQFKQPLKTDLLLEETISQSEIYESLRQRGYELNGEFQPITKACVNGAAGELVWSGKWIQFLDGMIQMSLLAQNTEGSCLPTLIRSIRIEPAQFLKQEERTFRFQDENNNLTMTTLNADWLQEEYQYLIKSSNKQTMPVRERSQWFARLQQYQQEQTVLVRQWMRMSHETPVTATQKKMLEDLESQLCQFQRQYTAVNVEELSEKAWNELLVKIQEQAELAHQINTYFSQARRQNTVQEGPVSPCRSASVSHVRMIEDLRQIVREQLQYQEREQTRRMQTCQEQKQFNSLYRRQLDILRSLTQAQCRLPVEMNMLRDMEKLIQEQQYRHEAMSPVSFTVKNWMNQLRQQQIILNEYFVQAQTPELRQIYTFLVKLCKDQLQQEMDFQTEARQIHGFVSQKLTTNFSLVQKLIAMSDVEEQEEESTLKRMYLEKLETLVQEMYDQTMLTQAIQESMQETYQTRCVQLREYLTTLEKMTGRQQEQEVESTTSPVQRQVRQMRETLTKFYQEARQFRQFEQQQMTMPVFYNAEARSVYSQGVEISGLYMAPVVSVAPISMKLREHEQEQRFAEFFSEEKSKSNETIEIELLNLIEAMHSLESLRETAETLRDTAQSIRMQEQQQPIQVSAKFTTKVSFSPLQAYISSTLDEAERQLIEETMSSMTSTYMPVQYQQMTKKYNYLMPQKFIEPLNEVEIYSQFQAESTMTPVFIVHPIEGHTNTLRTLARNIRAPVYGIQFTREALKYETVEELAKFYWTQIKSQFGEQTRVHLCGHAFGAMIALEMAMNQPQRCVSLTVLDDNMTQMSYDMYREQREEMEADAMMKFALQYYQSMNKVQFFNQLTEFKTTEERIRYIVKELMARSQFQFESVDLKDAIRAYIQKYVMQCQYIPCMQLRLPAVYLVKCGQMRNSLVQTKTYLQQLIEQCFNGRLESEQVDCDARSFLEGANAYQVATIINENMLRHF